MAQVPDFEGLTPEMRQDLVMRLRMVYTGGEGQQVFMSHAWRRLFRIQAPLVHEFILEFLSTCRMSDTEIGLDVADTLSFQLGGDGSERLIPDKGDLRDYWVEISSDKDFLGPAPSYVLIRDHVRRLCHRMIAYSISGRGQAPEKACQGEEERGQVVTRELPLIDLHELKMLNIYSRHSIAPLSVAHGCPSRGMSDLGQMMPAPS
ncbi:hypothetical protein Tco_1324284 [Tanacetum coccineum]